MSSIDILFKSLMNDVKKNNYYQSKVNERLNNEKIMKPAKSVRPRLEFAESEYEWTDLDTMKRNRTTI